MASWTQHPHALAAAAAAKAAARQGRFWDMHELLLQRQKAAARSRTIASGPVPVQPRRPGRCSGRPVKDRAAGAGRLGGAMRHTHHSPREGISVSPSSLVNSGKPAAATEFPTLVHVPADQAAHPNAAEDWWYTGGHLSSGRHEYGYQVQLVASGISQLSITDVTAGKNNAQSVTYKAGQFSVSDAELDVRMPDATLSGPVEVVRISERQHGPLHRPALTRPAEGRSDGTGHYRPQDNGPRRTVRAQPARVTVTASRHPRDAGRDLRRPHQPGIRSPGWFGAAAPRGSPCASSCDAHRVDPAR